MKIKTQFKMVGILFSLGFISLAVAAFLNGEYFACALSGGISIPAIMLVCKVGK